MSDGLPFPWLDKYLETCTTKDFAIIHFHQYSCMVIRLNVSGYGYHLYETVTLHTNGIHIVTRPEKIKRLTAHWLKHCTFQPLDDVGPRDINLVQATAKSALSEMVMHELLMDSLS